MIKETEIVLHEADEPDVVADLLDTDVLPGEHGAEVELLLVEANASAACHRLAEIQRVLFARRPFFDLHVDLFHYLRKCRYIRAVFRLCNGCLGYCHAVPTVLGTRWRAGFPRDSTRRLIR